MVFVFFYSCAPEKQKTNIVKTESGLTCDSVYLYYQNAEYNLVEFPMDSVVEMVFTGLNGFKLINGNNFIGGSLMVSDSTGDVIFKLDDVFLGLENEGVEKSLISKRVSMVLETGSPMKKGNIYTWENTIWDKKGNGKITAKTKIRLI